MAKRGFGSPRYDQNAKRRAQKMGNATLRARGKVYVWDHESGRAAALKRHARGRPPAGNAGEPKDAGAVGDEATQSEEEEES